MDFFLETFKKRKIGILVLWLPTFKPIIRVMCTYPQTEAEDLQQAFDGKKDGERRVDVLRYVVIQPGLVCFARRKALRQNALILLRHESWSSIGHTRPSFICLAHLMASSNNMLLNSLQFSLVISLALRSMWILCWLFVLNVYTC